MDLKGYFNLNPEIAIAFSGGTDSAYLLYMARQYAQRVEAFYARSVFQPTFELEDAKKFCHKYHIPLHIVDLDILSNHNVRENSGDRCYYCKQSIFQALLHASTQHGFSILADGTNASDQYVDRPGMRALDELKISSPLRICNLTKKEVRDASDKLQLFTAFKPSYSCLATRIETGVPITISQLDCIEQCENYLYQLGFTDYRARLYHDSIVIQVPENQFLRILEFRNEILMIFLQFHKRIYLDLLPRAKEYELPVARNASQLSENKEEPSPWNPKPFIKY